MVLEQTLLTTHLRRLECAFQSVIRCSAEGVDVVLQVSELILYIRNSEIIIRTDFIRCCKNNIFVLPEIMILELSNDTENQTAFEIQAYFNSTQSKWSLKRLV